MTTLDAKVLRGLDGSLLLVLRELLQRRRTTEAARALHMSQSAVSHALSRLRDLFDDPLFVRRPHGLEPTRRALALEPQLEALLEQAQVLLQGESPFDPSTSDRQFVAAAPEFVSALIGARLLVAMRKRAPGTVFHLRAMPHEAAFTALRRGEIDVALGRFSNVEREFASELLIEDRYCVVARRDHPRLQGQISEREFVETGHVFSWSPGEGGESDDIASAGDIVWHAIVPRWLTALVIVSSTDSIATVPGKLAERLIDVLQLQVLEAPFVRDQVTVSMLRRKDSVDAGAEWFSEEVRRAVRD